MSGSKYVPLVFLAFVVACEQPAAVPAYENITGRTLALCEPAPEQLYSVTIGPGGGRFTATGALLDVPAGALDRAVKFTVRVPQSTFAEIEVTADGRPSFTFLRPVTIGIGYARCQAAPLPGATAWHIDPATKAFLEEMGGVNDVANERIVFSTMHLSGYAIAN